MDVLHGKALRPLGLSPCECHQGVWVGEVAGESMEASPGRPTDPSGEEEELRGRKGGERKHWTHRTRRTRRRQVLMQPHSGCQLHPKEEDAPKRAQTEALRPTWRG